MSFQVKFINVGGAKCNWEAALPNLEYRTILKEIKKRHALCSKHPDIEVYGDGEGAITAGWRIVGEFTWTEIKDEKPKAKTKKAVSA